MAAGITRHCEEPANGGWCCTSLRGDRRATWQSIQKLNLKNTEKMNLV